MKDDKTAIAKYKKEIDKIKTKRVAEKKKQRELALMGVSNMTGGDDLDDAEEGEGMDGEMEGDDMENAEGMEGEGMEGDMENADG